MEVSKHSKLPDLGIIADPDRLFIPTHVVSLNNELAREYINPYGEPHFRFVYGGNETCFFQGRLAMKYPDLSKACRKEIVHYVNSEQHGLIQVPANPRDYPEELEQYKNHITIKKEYNHQKGDQFWILEGWRPGNSVGNDWDEEILGPPPYQGEYLPIFYCKTPTGQSREPNDGDVQRLKCLVTIQGDNYYIRNERWEDDFNPTTYVQRVARDYMAIEERTQREGEEFEDDCRRVIRQALKKRRYI